MIRFSGAAALVWLLSCAAVNAEPSYITVASTTSTESSGLFTHLLPRFTKASGIEVRVVAVGTGAAIRLARQGDADVLLVHHTASEEKFVAAGFGVKRFDLMWNDFIILGPGGDPAGVRKTTDAAAALKRIADRKRMFISRGDDSGTHKKELELWHAARVDPRGASGTWYREIGAGMGAALNMASAQGAYLLADRGTWLRFQNRRGLKILLTGDRRLINQYGVILVSNERHPHVKAAAGQSFIDWLLSDRGRSAIAAYRLDGESLFHPGRATVR